MDEKLKRLIEHLTATATLEDPEDAYDPAEPMHWTYAEDICQAIHEIWDVPMEDIARVVREHHKVLDERDRRWRDAKLNGGQWVRKL